MERLKLDTPYITLYLEDGIMYGLYKDGIRISLEIAKQVVQDRVTFCAGHSYPTMGTLKGGVILERDAREYFGTSEAVEGMTKMALLTDSLFTKVISNWYLNLSNPLVPTKVFTDKDDAVKWLKEIK